jgi:hypothetical protein
MLLRVSRREWLFTLITCIILAVAGALMIRDGDMWGWLPATFFGLGIPVAVAQVLGMGTLTLDANGFESSQMFQRQRLLWKDAAGFIAVDTLTAGRKLVCYDDANVSGRIADINDTLIGRNAALPDWRARALPGLLARTNLSV